MASTLVKQSDHIVFDCGKCIFCRKKRAYELACRCVLHASLYKQNCFLTLTYDETKPGYHNNFEYSDIQKFKKKLRRKCEPKKIEIFNVHEYGKKGKKHWHLIVFNHDFEDKEIHTYKEGRPLYKSDSLSKIWGNGNCSIGEVEAASAMYQAQYMEKDLKNGNITNGKRSHSKHSGIGGAYFKRNYRQILSLGYVPVDGRKLPLPRYFQRLAHKHFCHFFERSAFNDTSERRALYRPFKLGEANEEIAILYGRYVTQKKERIQELEKEWSEFILDHLTKKETPDFIKSAENALYDLRNKNNLERF